MKKIDSSIAMTIRRISNMLLCCLTYSMSLVGCVAPPASSAINGSQEPAHSSMSVDAEPVEVLIQGYNYTDQYIDSFTVNGQGGGNVFVSTPTSGGEKSTCCYAYLPGDRASIRVRRTAGYCTYTTVNQYGERSQWRRRLWQEVVVPVADVRLPAKALEVHFYKDGRVEAAITPAYSPLRLNLPVTSDGQRAGVPNIIPACNDEAR